MSNFSIDTKRCNYVIKLTDGRVLTQSKPFSNVYHDWECSGICDTIYGATFCSDTELYYFTPAELESLASSGNATII